MKKFILALVATAALVFGFASPAQADPGRADLSYAIDATTVSWTATNDTDHEVKVFLRYNDETDYVRQVGSVVLAPGASYTFVTVDIVPGNGIALKASLYQTQKNGSYTQVDRITADATE